MVKSRRVGRFFILLMLCLALYLPGISSLPATDRDESRYMQATHQMIESGDFIDIRFQDDPRYKKPVGIYWLQAGMGKAARSIGLPATFRAPYRLPSAIGASCAVLGLFLGFKSLIGEKKAFASSVFLASTLLLGVEAHLAKTDAMQLAAIVAMQAGLARLYMADKALRLWPERLLFWLGLGMGMLIKGPVAPTVATMTLGWICWKERSFWPVRALQPLPWMFLPLLMVGPWLLSIQGLSDGQFVQDSLGQDFLSKILEGQESHGAPPGTYLLLTPFLLWPMSWLLIPSAWQGLRHAKKNASRLITFTVGWLIPSWILFEIVPTKLPHYILPLIPALCLLGAIGFKDDEAIQTDSHSKFNWPERVGFGAWIIAGLIIIIGLPGASLWTIGRISEPALFVSLIGIVTAILTSRLKRNDHKLIASALTAVIIFGLIFEFALAQLSPLWPAETMRKIIASHGLTGLPVAIADYHEPSAVFNLGTKTILTDLNGIIGHASKNCQSIAILPSGQVQELTHGLPKVTRLDTIGHIDGFNYSKGRAINVDIIHVIRDLDVCRPNNSAANPNR